ncbi:MAG: glutathione S-transferase family protein [Pseudomonadota bacterium]
MNQPLVLNDPEKPVRVIGSNISYFTGKLETYFRCKGISYRLDSMEFPRDGLAAKRETGVQQMPVAVLPDGRWMTDTTKIIEWLEQQQPSPHIYPEDPVQRFLGLLIEDYADEWLWRPAMHFRWHYPHGAKLHSALIVNEMMNLVPGPKLFKRWVIRRRQRGGYTAGDGIGADAVKGVEAIYFRTLEQLDTLFRSRPYVLGSTPSIADVGLSGPFLRHFGQDPVPLLHMRERAPAVHEWLARLWNSQPAKASETPNGAKLESDEPLKPLFGEIGRCYLPYLNANAEAVRDGQKRFDARIDGVPYTKARYSQYRVWCLSQLRQKFESLPEEAKTRAEAFLQQTGCWQPLWQLSDIPLVVGQEEALPFRGDFKMVGVNE